VAAGAVLKHSRDANISREAVLSSGLSPQTPAYDVQQACATSLETSILVGKQDRRRPDRGGHSRRCRFRLRCAGLPQRQAAQADPALQSQQDRQDRLKLLTQLRPAMFTPSVPNVNERRTGLTMGDHCELMVKQWNISREAQDQLALASHLNGARGLRAGLL